MIKSAEGKPSISVIMLTYNRERLVGRMIECILAQTFADFEFIIVDNGSSDKSGKIADEYAKKDSRVKVIHRERGNIGSGRNAGLDAAKGKYIAFIDDDDLCDRDFLEFLYGLAKESDSDIAICASYGKENEEKLVMTPEEALITLLWRKKYNVQFPTKLITAPLMKKFRFSETANYDDIELMPPLMAEAKRIAYSGLPKYDFNRHDGNNSAWTTNHALIKPDTLGEYLRVYDERTAFLCKKFPDNAPYWRYFRHSFMISMVEKISRFELSDCYQIRDKLLSELLTVRDEFLNCPYILDFEKEWVNQYIV
jgi:glycosyltransferase involved in cell wall biosynthesis